MNIQLPSGVITKIDDADLHLLIGFRLFAQKELNTYYAIARKNKETFLVHRLLLTPKPTETIDHINGDGLDNRRKNLRICSKAQNQMNRRKTSGNMTSIFKGVCWHIKNKQYNANIRCNKKQHYLGSYKSEFIAALAYDIAAMNLFKEFALLNFPSLQMIKKHE